MVLHHSQQGPGRTVDQSPPTVHPDQRRAGAVSFWSSHVLAKGRVAREFPEEVPEARRVRTWESGTTIPQGLSSVFWWRMGGAEIPAMTDWPALVFTTASPSLAVRNRAHSAQGPRQQHPRVRPSPKNWQTLSPGQELVHPGHLHVCIHADPQTDTYAWMWVRVLHSGRGLKPPPPLKLRTSCQRAIRAGTTQHHQGTPENTSVPPKRRQDSQPGDVFFNFLRLISVCSCRVSHEQHL